MPIVFSLALALVIAGPLLAEQGEHGGRRQTGLGFGPNHGPNINLILQRLRLSDTEEAAAKTVQNELRPKIEKAAKAAELTADQRVALREAMYKLSDSGKSLHEIRQGIRDAMKSLNRTQEQIKAQKELTRLTSQLQERIRAALTRANQEAFDKAIKKGPGFWRQTCWRRRNKAGTPRQGSWPIALCFSLARRSRQPKSCSGAT